MKKGKLTIEQKARPWTPKDAANLQQLTRELIDEMGECDFRAMAFACEREFYARQAKEPTPPGITSWLAHSA